MLYNESRHPIEDNWDGEYCDRCKRPYRMGYLIPDEIWNKIAEPNKTLCIDCLDILLTKAGITADVVINPCWAGNANFKFDISDLPLKTN